MNYSDKLILRANELYHDFGGDDYASSHDEIFVLEESRWRRFSKNFFSGLRLVGEKTILDIGSGTGFVPAIIGAYLKNHDTLICSDISENMLQQCKTNISRMNFSCRTLYVKYDGVHLPAETGSIDIATVNSVLHHIPNTAVFLGEIDRIIKSGGYFIVGHESNADFFNNPVIWSLYRVLYLVYHPRSATDVLQRIGIGFFARASKKIEEDELTIKINKALLHEKLIDKRLTRSQINALVDFHSVKGFRVDQLSKLLSNFQLVHLETYNHLWWLFMQHYKNPIIRWLNGFLWLLFPKDGKTMMLVYVKK